MSNENAPIVDQLIARLCGESDFGALQVQRITGWGYNRAYRLIEVMVQEHRIEPLETKPYRFRVIDK